MPSGQMPNYFKLRRDLWLCARDLPRPQGAKLVYALLQLFFEGTDPDTRELPKDARHVYLAQRQTILTYRRNVLNGMKNGTKIDAKPTQKPTQELTPKTETDIEQGFLSLIDGLPAETQKVGTHPTRDPDRPVGGGSGWGHY